jgi:hypothetical protein
MVQSRIEEIDFRPRLPIVRLILACLVFGFLAYIFVREKSFEFNMADRANSAGLLIEAVGIGLLIVSGFGFIASFLLLQFRLRFTEAGIRRLTFFGPRFIPWSSVRGAQLGSYKGYLALELSVSRRRWICIPVLEYGKGFHLFEEIRKRLPVEVKASDRQLALLGGDHDV